MSEEKKEEILEKEKELEEKELEEKELKEKELETVAGGEDSCSSRRKEDRLRRRRLE